MDVFYFKEKFEDYYTDYDFKDGSHDLNHFRRVFRIASNLGSLKCDLLVLLAACYFHDLVNHPKDSPLRSQSSKDSAIKAMEILKEMDFPQEKLDAVYHCIEAHSFSSNIKAETLEAKVVQDADRMESLGAIGLARTFYVAGLMESQLFDGDDPLALNRELDDKKYALDHFKVKLLKIPELMNTESGKKLAAKRAQVLLDFLEQINIELKINKL